MFTKNKIIFLSVLIFTFLLAGKDVLASNTNGTIDATSRYAWGENVGWVDFGSEAGDVHVTDSELSGSAYGENIGWIDLSTIVNDDEGALSGYAWGENVGWVDFSQVVVGNDGVFSGGAYGENIGWITFGTDNNKVVTDWRPKSVRRHGSSGGGSLPGAAVTTSPVVVVPPATQTTDCKLGEKYSSITGQACTTTLVTPTTDCLSTYLFSPTTGESCHTNSNLNIPTTPTSSSCVITQTLYQGRADKDTIGIITEVKCLQTLLKIKSDGVFGPKTKESVIVFQNTNQLKADGIVGPMTREKLNIINNQ